MLRQYFILFIALCLLGACKPEVFSPKPQGYFMIDTPAEHEYKVFDKPGYPYTFEYPVYAEIVKDSAFFKEKADNPYWININFPTLGGELLLTYKHIGSLDEFHKMVQDAHGFTFFHHQKADYINEETFTNPGSGISFILRTVGGNAASRYQFTATDSVRNFMLGSLYFDVTPNADSLKPATDFIAQDILHMMQTLKFR